MFDQYYYANQGSEYIVYEVKNVDKGAQMSLYLNEKQIDTTNGLLGEFQLSGDNILLRIKNQALKSTHELTHNNSEIKLHKIKLKELRKILTVANIFNTINPTKEELIAAKFKPQSLLLPFLLLIIGFVVHYFTLDMSGFYQFLPAVPAGIAGWLIYDIVMERVTWLQGMRRGRLGFMALAIIFVIGIGEFLFRHVM